MEGFACFCGLVLLYSRRLRMMHCDMRFRLPSLSSCLVSSLSVSFSLLTFPFVLPPLPIPPIPFLTVPPLHLSSLPTPLSLSSPLLPPLPPSPPVSLASGKHYIQSLLGDAFTEEDIVEALHACNLNAEVALNALLTQRSSKPHSIRKETTMEGKSLSFAPLVQPSSKG